MLRPSLDYIYSTGRAKTFSDNFLPVHRGDNVLSERYFNYSWTPIKSGKNKVDGVLSIMQETTERVLGTIALIWSDGY